MQTAGYLEINGERIKVLARDSGNAKKGFIRYLKLRKSGQDGCRFTDEEKYLTLHNPEALERLKSGEVIGL